MKKINLIAILAMLLIAGCGQKQASETTTIGFCTDYYLIPTTLKGKVKEVKELNYRAVEKDGKIEKGDLLTKADFTTIGMVPNFAVSFDELGNVTKYEQLDGDKASQTSIETIENGRIIREDRKVNDSLIYYLPFEYDNNGRLVKLSAYFPVTDSLAGGLLISYDAEGNRIKYEYLNSKNIRSGYHTCTVDAEGHYLETKYFNPNDSLLVTTKNTYDENGSLAKQENLPGNEAGPMIWLYKNLKFDDKGNLIAFFSDVENGKYKLYTERTIVYY